MQYLYSCPPCQWIPLDRRTWTTLLNFCRHSDNYWHASDIHQHLQFRRKKYWQFFKSSLNNSCYIKISRGYWTLHQVELPTLAVGVIRGQSKALGTDTLERSWEVNTAEGTVVLGTTALINICNINSTANLFLTLIYFILDKLHLGKLCRRQIHLKFDSH